jgi:acid-sensing ion channel, other
MNNLFETDKTWATTFVLNHPSKVYLHSTDEITGNDILPSFTWDDGIAIDLLIAMKQTYTTTDAEQLTVGQRKCIFQDEVDLNYFKNDVYSLSACMIQCRMKKANKLCKCIPPFYVPATGSYRECSLSDFRCLRDNQENITDIRGCLHCELSCFNTVYESEKFMKK